jgi:hypothetical protein
MVHSNEVVVIMPILKGKALLLPTMKANMSVAIATGTLIVTFGTR